MTLLPTHEASGRRPVPKTLAASSTLRMSSVILHSLLIAIHLALVVIWVRELEHRVSVGLATQKLASFPITATATAFGTVRIWCVSLLLLRQYRYKFKSQIYSALLVFVTQRLSVRLSLQLDQLLTSTHDNAAAWAGLGAAISHLWKKRGILAHGSLCSEFSPSSCILRSS